jgi:hypothetical protein
MSRIFGKVCQNGYVVRDIEAAMKHWTEVLGVGPFYYIERVHMDWFRYRGADSPAPECSIALANTGDLQIELIQQHDTARSMYRDFTERGREGLQHMSYWTTNYEEDFTRFLNLGYRVGQEGQIGGPQGRFAYFDTETHPGTIIEISDISGPKGQFFQRIREAAATWDGTRPIRIARG